MSGGPLVALATVGVLVDVTTTAHILSSSAYAEANVLLDRVAEVDPALSLLLFVSYCLAHLAVAALSFGWLSDVVAVFLVVAMGLGGLNNLFLFATGSALYPHAGIPTELAVHLLKPAAGILLGLVVAGRRGPLPWPEVLVVVTPGVVLGALLLVL